MESSSTNKIESTPTTSTLRAGSGYLHGIEPLNGNNFTTWLEQVKLTLGFMDLDYSLRHEAPSPLDTDFRVEQKKVHDQWERSNRMSLMVIKNSISPTIRGAIPNSENAKVYLDLFEEQFKGTSKTNACIVILKMLTTKYSGPGGVRDHIMMMNDMANQLKTLDMEISEEFLVHFIMTSLPSQFDIFKINYNTQKEKWKMSEMIAMCVQEEERLKHEKPNVAHITTSNPNKKKYSFKNKGQQGDKSKPNKFSTLGASTSTFKGTPKCRFCHKKGHIQSDCLKFKEWLAKKGIAFNLMIYESFNVNVPCNT
ncbi:hypothetical protein E3N88_09424 [Mikania micrantha]|uniref:CCHC-type domain-containing protein n=1 Tax=Mikania micrantha TaxID=192012 RepID=A0A5N6PJX5_9ASTR|nr:hypothetical protein E3N88_09424 [Mikania micrantha]